MREHVSFKATEDSRRLTLPQKAEDYKLELPKDFKAPDGIEFKPDPNDPRWPMLREYALKAGWSQDDVSRILELDAAGQVGSQQAISNAKAAEVAQLGANGTARVTAVNTFVASAPNVTAEEAAEFAKFNFTATQIKVMEKIMAHVRTQGAGGPNSGHREAPAENGKIPGYETMTFEQRRFAQDQQRRGASAR